MGARHHSELVAWQLASQVRDELVDVLAAPEVARHSRFCDQLSDAASSGPRNIAEGFARYSHAEFARFLGIALGSLAELQTLLDEALARRFVSAPRTTHPCARARDSPPYWNSPTSSPGNICPVSSRLRCSSKHVARSWRMCPLFDRSRYWCR